ncbi:hypothetical protein HOE07_05185, partial [archaeon]|nr:hypothetical protein [archaeon]
MGFVHKKRIHNRDYYYASYRGEDGKVCSKYLGSDEKLALKKEKDMDGGKADLYVYSLIFLLLGLCFFGGMFSYTGFVTYNGGVDLSWNESWDVDSSFVRVSLGSDVYDIPVSVVDGSVVVDLSVFDFNSTGVGYVDLIVNESVVDSASFEIAEESYFNESLSAQNLTLNDTELNNSVDGFNSSLDLNESVSLNESLDLNESVEESLNVSVDVPVVNETVEDVDESVELVNESVEDVDETVEEVLNESLNVSVEVPIVNLTANETVIIPVNITNQTVNYTIAGVNVSEEVVQYGAVIGEPVKWKKKIVLSESTANLSVDIPETAENVTVVEIVDDVETVLDNVKVNNSGVISDLDGSDLDSPTGFFNLISGMFSASITGFFVAGEPVENITLIIEEEVEEVEVEYYTEAPEASEENTSYGKKVVVSSETHYENILTYTTIPEIALDAVNLYWIVNGSRVVHSFDGYDTNADGLVDYLEWVTPHTSEQEFQIELTILNVQSYPFVGGSWTVMFNTSGTADLSVNAINTTSFGVDLQFIEIRCGEDVVNSSYNGSIFVADYSCNQTGFEESRVLTAGVHDLEFRFGDLVAYAHNDASYPNCTGATSNGIWVINDSQTVNDTVTCNTITIQDGGTLVVDTTVNNVSITINATNITVDVGGSINANEKGWMLSEGPGQGSTGTYDQGGGGGGYGGKGGNGESGVAGGSHFGDSLVPTRLGSGGGYCSQASCNSGGSGGGAIKLDVIDTFTLNGSVSADGESGTTYQTFYAGGGGSAGSIFVNTSVLRGIGNFSAVGGDGADNSGGDGGGGSGGRVAVYYDSVEDVDITTSTVAGGTGPGSAQDGDPGTLGFIDRDDRHLTIYSGWEFSSNMNYTNVSVYSSLTRMNKSINMNASNWNAFGDFNMTCYGNTYDFTLDVVNDVNFSRSTIKNLGRANLDCDNVDVNATESSVVFMEDITIEVGGNISLD